jgi:4-amino-4-deoxy-L-arabinose transferase-like glycosyltransferase
VIATRRIPSLWRLSAEAWIWIGIAGLLAIRFVLALHAISRPGIQQDETLFVNAATLRLPGVNMPVTFHGIPVMVFPYIGALKSWVADPVFALFGTNPTTIRLPAVILTTVGLAVLYPALRGLVNRPVAIATVCVLCFDNSVFWLTRDDVGPSAIEFMLKCVALLCIARFAVRRNHAWLIALLVTLALGVFNKLNFIWLVNAATVASVVVIVRYRLAARRAVSLVTTWFGGLAVIYAVFAWYYISHHIGTLLTGPSGGALTQPWSGYERGMSLVLSGTWFYDYALAPLGPLGPRMVVVWMTLILFVIGTLASMLPGRHRSFSVSLIALVTLLTAVQILFTGEATAGWHYVEVFPFITIVAAYGVYALAVTLCRRRWQSTAAVALAATAAVGYSVVLMAKYADALTREPVNPAWSPAIYTLSRDLQHTQAHVYTADWGIFDPLFALHPGTRWGEYEFALTNPDPAALRALGQSLESLPGPKLIVTHAPDRLEFPQADRNLAIATHGHLKLALTVPGLDHKPLYEIYKLR